MPNYNGIRSGTNFNDRMRENAKESLRRNFKRSITYKEVDKYNSDGTITNEFPIQIFKSSNKLKKYKNFISHPDFPVNYGDMFKLNDDFLIITELNDYNQISEDGTMWKCNDILKWKYNGTVYEQRCFADKKSVSLTDSEQNFATLNNKIVVYAQHTDEIENIEINQDFVFGNHFKTVYKLVEVDDSTRDGLLVMTMDRVEFSTGDDLVDNVADNPNADNTALQLNSQLDDSYYLVTPKTADIVSYSTVTIQVEHYDSLNNIIATNFSYNVTGLNVADYILVVVDNNTVEITNNDGLGSGVLEITDTDTAEVLDFPIELTGVF